MYFLNKCLYKRKGFDTFAYFFLPLVVLLTGCITSGGGAGGSHPAGWNPFPPGKAGDYSCDDVGGNAAVYCATGEHPDLCNC